MTKGAPLLCAPLFLSSSLLSPTALHLSFTGLHLFFSPLLPSPLCLSDTHTHTHTPTHTNTHIHTRTHTHTHTHITWKDPSIVRSCGFLSGDAYSQREMRPTLDKQQPYAILL